MIDELVKINNIIWNISQKIKKTTFNSLISFLVQI